MLLHSVDCKFLARKIAFRRCVTLRFHAILCVQILNAIGVGLENDDVFQDDDKAKLFVIKIS